MSQLDTRTIMEVTCVQTDERFQCATDESLLHGMMRLGRKGIPAGCANGGCGICKVKVLTGQVVQLGPVSRAHVSVEEQQCGFTLACRVAPASEVQVEVVGKLVRSFSMRSAVLEERCANALQIGDPR